MATETEAAREAVEEHADNNGNGAVAPEDDAAEHSPAEHRSHKALFKFSAYVNIGPGAQDCAEGRDGSCTNALHFHAWCRAVNQFQHQSIREKALAAKARKLRQLRDTDSDSYVILDAGIAELLHSGSREGIIEELAQRDFLTDYLAAASEVEEEEEFKTAEEDRLRFQALTAMPEDQRPAEEYAELEEHLAEYGNRTQAAFEERQKPLKESLAERSIEELGELVREQRIDAEASQVFNATYAQWEQYIGTLKCCPDDRMPSERYFSDINVMLAAAPEVIEVLERTFRDLDSEASRAAKNS